MNLSNAEECPITSVKRTRCNKQIRAQEVRVIGEDGKQVGILPLAEALQYAESQGVDLVEVSPEANPPVCRVMDFGKYKYELQKKQQEGRKKQTLIQLKEIKFRPKTDDHDFETKLKHIRRFLEAGDKCKVTVAFRGREMMHRDRGEMVLRRVLEELGEEAKIDQQPSMEGRTMNMVLSAVDKKIK